MSDQIRDAIRDGNHASEELLPLVYDELRQLASSYLANERPGRTLQPTALVHEAYLRIVRSDPESWDGKHHFFGAAAMAMRRIVIDDARRRLALKRGGDRSRLEFDEEFAYSPTAPEDLLALDEALVKLEERHPRLCRVVVLRYFGGMSEDDTAQLLDVSVRTVQRDWVLAKVYLGELFESSARSSE